MVVPVLVLLPLLSRSWNTIQPLTQPLPLGPEPEPHTGALASGASLRHMTTAPPRRMASLRANRMSDKNVLTPEAIELDCHIRLKDGTASPVKMARTEMVTSNSINVTPMLRLREAGCWKIRKRSGLMDFEAWPTF